MNGHVDTLHTISECSFDVFHCDMLRQLAKINAFTCFSALQLYTQEFYRTVIEPKLAPDGIFVTQSGPAGVLSCSEVFTPINHTLQSVFPRVIPYTQHIPSYVDTWVWPISSEVLYNARKYD
jgi:thermospermine synthase